MRRAFDRLIRTLLSNVMRLEGGQVNLHSEKKSEALLLSAPQILRPPSLSAGGKSVQCELVGGAYVCAA